MIRPRRNCLDAERDFPEAVPATNNPADFHLIMTLKATVLLAALALVGCTQSTPSTDSKSTNSSSSAAPAAPASAAPAPAASTPAAAAPATPAPAAAAASAPASTDWTTTASGLKYQVMNHGTGTTSPVPTDLVTVNYKGTLLDGTVFDSSYDRGQPTSFPLNQVIAGWTEGLQLMKVGDKFKFQIPANLAYGDRSPSPKIPPGSTLVFEVELLKIGR